MTIEYLLEFCKNKNIEIEEDKNNNQDIYNSIIKYFYFERLGWCACGCPEVALEEIKKYLCVVRERHNNILSFDAANKKSKNLMFEYFGVDSIYKHPLLLCLAYSLDAAEITEHGTGIGSAWLTRDGYILDYCFKKCNKIDI